jgi:ABC-type transport system involved in multi-copper enzyme maturation permease subunit
MWLTGPIFDKELRVSSRRRRNYVLRFVFVAAFTLLMVLIWLEVVAEDTSVLYQSSRRAHAGQLIAAFVIWFQFVAAQVVAVVMLSTSISDEVYHRTLGLLMTTPVGSFQIVFGKLLSKLLQLVLLLAVTLPLLAIVRVFGGVPWEYVLSGLCVTLTTSILLGSLSLFFSIFTRKAYSVIITTVFVLGLLFALTPLLARLLLNSVVPSSVFRDVLYRLNPFVLLFSATRGLMSAQPMGFRYWPVYCGLALGASVLLLSFATLLVRRAALRQAVGQTLLLPGSRVGKLISGGQRDERTRRVVGPAVLWKERRASLLGKRKAVTLAGIGLAATLVLFTYALCASRGVLDEKQVQGSYMVIFVAVGMLYSTVLPATCVTAEKESRTWPLLLTTTVGNWEIVWSKLAGNLRRCLPQWLLLVVHLLIFVSAGIVHAIAIPQFLLLVVWVVFFLSSAGLYFSTRFRHTTTAVVANIALAAGLWLVGPLLLGIMFSLRRGAHRPWELYMDFNPIVQAVVVAGATANKGGLGLYEWAQGSMRDASSATAWIALTFLVYTVIALIFIVRAAARVRRHPF